MSKAPAPLQVKNKDDWEDISCHIMSWLMDSSSTGWIF